jgi:hypothetical protein
MKNPPGKPIVYVLLALILFSLLGLEFAVFFLSRLVDGRSAAQVFSWPINWYGAVFHWTITMLLWGVGALGVYGWLKKRRVLSELIRFDFGQQDSLLLLVGLLFVVVYEVVYSRLTGLVIPQIWREFQGFQNMYGGQAWIVLIFQNLYYLVEFALVVMMIAFFQRAGEMWTKLTWFPWGALGIALTWGMIHLVTNPGGALGVIIWSLLLGFLFVLSKKSFFLTWVIGVLGFII